VKLEAPVIIRAKKIGGKPGLDRAAADAQIPADFIDGAVGQHCVL
jgi:hypothetical protein